MYFAYIKTLRSGKRGGPQNCKYLLRYEPTKRPRQTNHFAHIYVPGGGGSERGMGNVTICQGKMGVDERGLEKNSGEIVCSDLVHWTTAPWSHKSKGEEE